MGTPYRGLPAGRMTGQTVYQAGDERGEPPAEQPTGARPLGQERHLPVDRGAAAVGRGEVDPAGVVADREAAGVGVAERAVLGEAGDLVPAGDPAPDEDP